MIGVSGNRGFNGIPFIALLEELIPSPRKSDLHLEGFSWSGALMNSRSKAAAGGKQHVAATR